MHREPSFQLQLEKFAFIHCFRYSPSLCLAELIAFYDFAERKHFFFHFDFKPEHNNNNPFRIDAIFVERRKEMVGRLGRVHSRFIGVCESKTNREKCN